MRRVLFLLIVILSLGGLSWLSGLRVPPPPNLNAVLSLTPWGLVRLVDAPLWRIPSPRPPLWRRPEVFSLLILQSFGAVAALIQISRKKADE